MSATCGSPPHGPWWQGQSRSPKHWWPIMQEQFVQSVHSKASNLIHRNIKTQHQTENYMWPAEWCHQRSCDENKGEGKVKTGKSGKNILKIGWWDKQMCSWSIFRLVSLCQSQNNRVGTAAWREQQTSEGLCNQHGRDSRITPWKWMRQSQITCHLYSLQKHFGERTPHPPSSTVLLDKLTRSLQNNELVTVFTWKICWQVTCIKNWTFK
jgi:hypothetical protein